MSTGIVIPLNVGDVIRVGRFKNKRIEVKEIGKDEFGLPTVNGRGIMKIRIEKLMKDGKHPAGGNKVIKEKIEKYLNESNMIIKKNLAYLGGQDKIPDSHKTTQIHDWVGTLTHLIQTQKYTWKDALNYLGKKHYFSPQDYEDTKYAFKMLTGKKLEDSKPGDKYA
jgi:hypothetical protein